METALGYVGFLSSRGTLTRLGRRTGDAPIRAKKDQHAPTLLDIAMLLQLLVKATALFLPCRRSSKRSTPYQVTGATDVKRLASPPPSPERPNVGGVATAAGVGTVLNFERGDSWSMVESPRPPPPPLLFANATALTVCCCRARYRYTTYYYPRRLPNAYAMYATILLLQHGAPSPREGDQTTAIGGVLCFCAVRVLLHVLPTRPRSSRLCQLAKRFQFEIWASL